MVRKAHIRRDQVERYIRLRRERERLFSGGDIHGVVENSARKAPHASVVFNDQDAPRLPPKRWTDDG
jgi:hypothetical protein